MPVPQWRRIFNSSFAFVGIQLAVSHHDIAVIWVAFFSRCQRYRCWQGYTAVLANGTGRYTGLSVTSEMVFRMRLQQEAGCAGVVGGCVVVPTYDFSCSAGVAGGCPYGSVHQPDKPAIGARVALQLYKQLVAPSTPEVVAGKSHDHC